MYLQYLYKAHLDMSLIFVIFVYNINNKIYGINEVK